MGEKVVVEPFIFTVLETRWESQLGEGAASKTPNGRFLLVKLSITNSGNEDAGVPMLTLEDNKGQTFREFQEGNLIPNYLGMFRRVGPAQTETGQICFDVPQSAYKIRLSNGADDERLAYVDLPLLMD
jgi:hypothetical protein